MSNIWILEDEQSSRFVYKEILSPYHHLTFFEDIQYFDEHYSITNEIPDLFIADIILTDGEFPPYLRKIKPFEFPFIISSSVDEQKCIDSCYSLGAIDYLVKPFNRGELLAKVNRAITHDQNQKSVRHNVRSELLQSMMRTIANESSSFPEESRLRLV